MQTHLERSLRIQSKPLYGSLYNWAMNEIDAEGEIVGQDWIPWPWTVRFAGIDTCLAEDVTVTDAIRNLETEDEDEEVPEIVSSPRVIVVKMKASEISLRMFGTNRILSHITLMIRPKMNEGELQTCSASGETACSFDVDFRRVTEPDRIEFNLSVDPDTFDRHAQAVLSRAVDEIHFDVSWVSGFYAQWSPSISTEEIRILTTDDAHHVERPDGFEAAVPRLGHVGTARLRMVMARSSIGQSEKAGTCEPPEPQDQVEIETSATADSEAQLLSMLRSTRRWAVLCFVALAILIPVTLLT